MPAISPRKRHKSRWLILQCLYQLQLNEKDPKEVEAESKESHIYRLADKEYYHSVFQGIIEHKEELNIILADINKFTNTKFDPIMLAVLQIGLYELQYRKDIDHPVIIKEAIVLCKEFMHAESHVFANSILDQAAKKLRPELGGDVEADIAVTPADNIADATEADSTGTPADNIADATESDSTETPTENVADATEADSTETPAENVADATEADSTETPTENIADATEANSAGTPAENIADATESNIADLAVDKKA